MNFEIKKAERQARKARIALAGPSGCGKTWTALAFGAALGRHMVVIDTERASATLYAGEGEGEFAFDHLDMPSYEPEALIAALHQCAAAGYDVVVLDSLTHFWSGQGGVLEQVDRAAKRSSGGNTFAAWKDVRPMERRLMDAMVSYPGHVLVTMRTKTEYVIEEDSRGRKVPRKIGMKPEQREGIEYEFDLVADLDYEHTLVVTKSRCRVLADAVVQRPDGRVAATLRDWLASGATPTGPPPAMPAPSSNGQPPPPPRTDGDRRHWMALWVTRYETATTPAELEELGYRANDAVRNGLCLPGERDDLRVLLRTKAGEMPATEAHLTRVHAALGDRHVTDRDDKLAVLSRLIGSLVTSSAELTCAEADAVYDQVRNAPPGLDLVTGETVPEGVGVPVETGATR